VGFLKKERVQVKTPRELKSSLIVLIEARVVYRLQRFELDPVSGSDKTVDKGVRQLDDSRIKHVFGDKMCITICFGHQKMDSRQKNIMETLCHIILRDNMSLVLSITFCRKYDKTTRDEHLVMWEWAIDLIM